MILDVQQYVGDEVQTPLMVNLCLNGGRQSMDSLF
jgi:hypothetical protein